ncbi:response regulator transcription factor [Methylobacterium nodulans]|uniref:Response regulator receiver protein n=1 Tax=Methylobacterium nodulans (strain LMG 21967 / CNCM I-2342 / ORS 2060) TaxID=460265 RepID=B8IX31_METNO|nr:response regulator [Methylobacterium nodulans]ACL63072.1 response regulator receiver protein [Methylobacterium nodulans ORS 2060]
MPWNTALPIFIAEDDPALLNSLAFMLQGEGYRVVTFESGSELLSAFPGAKPGCVLLDYVMPGMSGLEVYHQLRERGVDVPVLLLTGHPDPSIRRRAREAGLPLIEKPLAQDLLSAIEAAASPLH